MKVEFRIENESATIVLIPKGDMEFALCKAIGSLNYTFVGTSGHYEDSYENGIEIKFAPTKKDAKQ